MKFFSGVSFIIVPKNADDSNDYEVDCMFKVLENSTKKSIKILRDETSDYTITANFEWDTDYDRECKITLTASDIRILESFIENVNHIISENFIKIC